MSILLFKLLSLICILLVSIIGGLLPIKAKVTQDNIHRFRLGDRFSSGVFLGAAFFHMLPDANADFFKLYHHNDFPIINAICILGFLVLLLIEQIIVDILKKLWKSDVVVIPYILAVTLSIHSIVAGMALGLNIEFSMVVIIFVAIIAHKGPESFALGFSLKRHEMPYKRMRNVILVFSIMTPLGILLGSYLPHILQGNTSLIVTAVFHAFAAGTFLYIATVHGISKPFMGNHEDKIEGFVAFTVGVALMASITLWL